MSKKQTITVLTTDIDVYTSARRTLNVEAEVMGHWAVHRRVEPNMKPAGRRWSITHVPEQMCVIRSLHNKRQALQTMKELHLAFPSFNHESVTQQRQVRAWITDRFTDQEIFGY